MLPSLLHVAALREVSLVTVKLKRSLLPLVTITMAHWKAMGQWKVKAKGKGLWKAEPRSEAKILRLH